MVDTAMCASPPARLNATKAWESRGEMISPDAPITRKTDDKLGRAAFARALAKAVLEFDGDDSFVVGIHGKWGTGKHRS